MKIKTAILAGASALVLAGCAETWAPPPGVDPSVFQQQTANCRLFSRGVTPQPGGFFASGSPRFVGTAMGAYALGSLIGMAVQQQENFNDCMAASGWRAVQR